VASRFPLTPTHTVTLYDHTLIVETVLALKTGPQPLWVVHTTAPLPASFHEWRNQLATIQDRVRARGSRGLIVVGDFNADWGNQGFNGLLSTGLTDGAAARGHPLQMTWSQTVAPIPPFVRIDHVLTGQGAAVVRIATEEGVGSDHRDVVATIAVHPPPKA
jgi:endonuclease/exonuclease/phosphatase (EEP) superfamily protein YafD